MKTTLDNVHITNASDKDLGLLPERALPLTRSEALHLLRLCAGSTAPIDAIEMTLFAKIRRYLSESDQTFSPSARLRRARAAK